MKTLKLKAFQRLNVTRIANKIIAFFTVFCSQKSAYSSFCPNLASLYKSRPQNAPFCTVFYVTFGGKAEFGQTC